MTRKARRHVAALGLAAAVVTLGSSVAVAQTGTGAHAFYVAEFEVHDREGLKPYSTQIEGTLAPFGGRFVVRGAGITPLEGDAPKGMVIIEFDSLAVAKSWYDSEAYRRIRPIRHRNATSRVYILEAPSAATAVGAARASQPPVVRVAELDIDPAQLDRYGALVREEMETSVRIEPGVLAIFAVGEKDNPAKLRFLEMYADEAAYQSHIASPHFRRYVTSTEGMIVSRRLIETVPLQLSAKKSLVSTE